VKLAIKQLPQLAAGLEAVLKLKIDPVRCDKLARFAKSVQIELEEFNSRRREFARKYGEPLATGGYGFKTGRQNEEFSDAVEAIADREIDLPDVDPIKLSEFPKDTENLGTMLLNLDAIRE